MELKQQAAAEDEPRKRHHMVRRIRKAAKFADVLSSISSVKGLVDTRSKLDILGYAAWMRAALLFEQEHWDQALEKFSLAKAIYDRLASAGTQQQQALCHATMDEIDPQIRFCAYQLRLSGHKDAAMLVKNIQKKADADKDVESLAAKLNAAGTGATKEEKTTLLTSVTWRGQPVPLRNVELAVVLLKVQDAEKGVDEALAEGRKKVDVFDSVLSTYSDTSLLSKRLVEDNKIAAAKVKSSKTDTNAANLRLIDDYITYRYINRRIQRNNILAETLQARLDEKGKHASRHADIVKLYDSILQSINEIKDLQTVQDNVNFAQEVEGVESYYKALRCSHVAEVYAQNSQANEALALFDRAKNHITNAKSLLGGGTEEDDGPGGLTLSDLQALESTIRGQKSRTHATWYIANGDTSVTANLQDMDIDRQPKAKADAALIERLDIYPTNLSLSQPNLVAMPPKMEAIAPKPFFIDIANNYIDYPSELAAKVGKKAPKTNAPEAKSGWLGGLWGGRK